LPCGPETAILDHDWRFGMKKLFFVMVICSALSAGAPLFAQQISEGKESKHYYVRVDLEKVYPYRKGYIVQYRKGVNGMTRAYIPYEWFTAAAGKGDLITVEGRTWPSMTIFYNEGKFSRVALYVHQSKGHTTWGNVPITVNIDDKFENVEELQIEFE
jgi:hypothetical protein